MFKHIMSLILALVLALAFVSCEESDEVDAVAQAQKCLDAIPADDGSDAINCLNFIDQYSGQQANILKCSIYFIYGGLTTNKIVDAYKQLDGGKDSSNADIVDKEAVYIGALTLNSPSDAEGLAAAKNANTFCKASGVSGLIYLSGLAVLGSTLNVAGGGFSAIPPTQAEIDTALSNCTADPPASNCDPTVIGETVSTIADAYCSGSNEDSEVCQDINEAVDSSGGSTENIGEAIYCYLDGKTYDPAQSPPCQ